MAIHAPITGAPTRAPVYSAPRPAVSRARPSREGDPLGALGRGASPPTVASVPGAEADKLLQRFRQLDTRNQARLLKTALAMIEAQEDAKLPPREREAKRLIDRIERCLELLAAEGVANTIATRIWRLMVEDDTAELTALGVDYFSHPNFPCGGDAAWRNAA